MIGFNRASHHVSSDSPFPNSKECLPLRLLDVQGKRTVDFDPQCTVERSHVVPLQCMPLSFQLLLCTLDYLSSKISPNPLNPYTRGSPISTISGTCVIHTSGVGTSGGSLYSITRKNQAEIYCIKYHISSYKTRGYYFFNRAYNSLYELNLTLDPNLQ